MKNIQGLVSFIESAAAGSFTAAATKLDLTPAAVSKNVIRLEQQLQVRLFNRSTRRLKLTQEGEGFLAKAVEALRKLDEAVSEVTQAGNEPAGRVRISAGVSSGRQYVLPVLPELTARYPGLEIEVRLDNRAVDLVAEGFDIAVRGGVIRDSSLVARLVGRLPVVLVAAPRYLREQGIPETPADLVDHCVLGVRFSSGEIAIWRFRKPSGRDFMEWEPTAKVWVSDPDALIDLVLAGHGIAEIGLHHVAPYLRQGQLKILLREHHDPGQREIMLHYPHRQFLSARVRVVVDALLAHFKQQEELHLDSRTLPAEWSAS